MPHRAYDRYVGMRTFALLGTVNGSRVRRRLYRTRYCTRVFTLASKFGKNVLLRMTRWQESIRLSQSEPLRTRTTPPLRHVMAQMLCRAFVPYFHVVFSLPAPIAEVAYQNKAVIYDILFKASAETVGPPRRIRFHRHGVRPG